MKWTDKLLRWIARKAVAATLKRSESYAAAKSSRMTGNWLAASDTVNNIISSSSATVRNRIRQLVRDFPYFARAVNAAVDYTVGPGLVYQARIRTGQDIQLDQKAIDAAESEFQYFNDEADAEGKLSFYEMQQLGKRQDCECGEFLLVRIDRKIIGRRFPISYRMYEPDWLTSSVTSVAKKNSVDQGVEYDTATGIIEAYHFTDPDGWGKAVRVPASHVIHGFKTLRPGQRRGISDLTCGVLVAKDLSSLMDSELSAANMASKWLAFVESADPMSRQMGLQTYDDNLKIEELENGIIEYLRAGEKVTLSNNPRPGANFSPFVRLVLCMFSVSSGIPYEILSGDYKGLSFTNGKMIRNDFSHSLRPQIARMVRHLCLPVLGQWMDVAVLSGRLKFPDYFSDRSKYLRSEWQSPGAETIDPLRETKAWAEQIKTRLRSPQEFIRKVTGRDPEEVLDEIQQFDAWTNERGLNLEKVSNALANNPAALGAAETTKE
ncbi:MAG: phage portal protein [Bacilli bacterium]|jgi:lambda family phage portal protein